MAPNQSTSLATTRWVIIMMYVGSLIVYPLIGANVKIAPSLSPDNVSLLGSVLLAVGLADYVISLFLERKLLAQARSHIGHGNPAGPAAFLVAALGVSLAVYGFVLTMLGAPSWGLALYALCFAHGVHLALRWPHYEHAAEPRYPNQ
jgi:hypothetical protein